MANATYYLTPNAAGTAFVGTGYTPDGTLPKSAIPCTKEQAQDWQQLVPSSGEIVAAPDAVLLAQARAAQIVTLRQACSNAITSGIPVTVSTGSYTLANTPTDQVNALMASQTAQGALAKAQAWAASTNYAPNSLCSVGGVVLWTQDGGKSGSSAPTAPSEFGVPVTDGAVTWELMGLLAGLAAGGTIFLTPQDTISAFEQGVAYIEAQRGQYKQLKAQVFAATTVAEVQAIVWP